MAASGALLLGSLGIGAYALKKQQDLADSKNLINTVNGSDTYQGRTMTEWFKLNMNGSDRVVDKKTGKVVSAVTHPLPLLKERAQRKHEAVVGGPIRNKIPTVPTQVAQTGMVTNNVQ